MAGPEDIAAVTGGSPSPGVTAAALGRPGASQMYRAPSPPPGWLEQLGAAVGVGGSGQPPVVYGQRRTGYPDAAEIANARSSDFSYGSGNEAFNEGKVANVWSDPRNRQPVGVDDLNDPTGAATDPRLRNLISGTPGTGQVYEAAQLAILRSPISALGYDPRQAALDQKSGANTTIAGMFSKKSDSIYANAAYPSSLVHESTHRGLERLRQARNEDGTPVVPPALWGRLPEKEEDLVRYVMAFHMGDPEKGKVEDLGEEQRQRALIRFGKTFNDPQKPDPQPERGAKDRIAAMNELNDVASRYYASLKPGGPR